MKKRFHLLIIIAILVIGFVLGSFFDLQIDKALFVKDNAFGLIMASFGVYPCYAGLAFVGGGLMSTTIKRKELQLGDQIYSLDLIKEMIRIEKMKNQYHLLPEIVKEIDKELNKGK